MNRNGTNTSVQAFRCICIFRQSQNRLPGFSRRAVLLYAHSRLMP